jgi:hypothetical protein
VIEAQTNRHVPADLVLPPRCCSPPLINPPPAMTTTCVDYQRVDETIEACSRLLGLNPNDAPTCLVRGTRHLDEAIPTARSPTSTKRSQTSIR